MSELETKRFSYFYSGQYFQPPVAQDRVRVRSLTPADGINNDVNVIYTATV